MVQKDFYAWALDTFGAEGVTVAERGRRHFEEDAELQQAAGMTEEMAHKIVAHVWSKPASTVATEMGQAQGTLYAFAEALGVNAALCADTELIRCQSKGVAHHNARWDVKKKAGV